MSTADERYNIREERRSKKQLSCAECHRLKLKCDRTVPCANCVRRECAELCPDQIRIKKSKSDNADSAVVTELRDRLAAIEGLLSGLGGAGAAAAVASGSRGDRDGSRKRDREPGRERDHDRERALRHDEMDEATHERDRDGERSRRPHEREYDHHRQLDRDYERDRDRERREAPSRYAHRPKFDYHRSRSPSPARFHRGERSPRHSPYPAGPANPPPAAVHHAEPRPRDREPEPHPAFGRSTTHPDHHRGHEREIARPPLPPVRSSPRDPGSSSTRESPRDAFSFSYDHHTPPTSAPTGQPPYGPGAGNDESYGTLVIDRSGRSKWLGPTAATEWLKNQEISGGDSPRRSRSPTPPTADTNTGGFAEESLFPFASWGPPPTMETIMFHLPPPDEAAVLISAYYTNYAWNHDVAPRRTVQPLFDRAYDANTDQPLARRVHPQQLALLFIIMAMGMLHNPELPPHDNNAEHLLAAARWCLIQGDFMGHNTVNGLQAVVIMAHYHLETEKGRNGDSAWPLWGLAMRLITAMGMHRDGARWNLHPDLVEERRHVFWECYTIDTFQANCFSRPSALRPEHIDAEFPSQTWSDGPSGLKSFRTLKFELVRISGAVLDQAMDVRPTPYTAITALYDRLCAFERQIPFHMRCRTALLALLSVYADAESATRDSPEVNRGNLHRTFQQFTLALNISETILFLQRPYFVKALQESPQDPTRSTYGRSYLAVVERCNVLIDVVGGLYELYPTVTARHWFFWFHLFSAAVCMGTIVIKDPSNPLSEACVHQIDQSIRLYSSVLRDHAIPSLVQNHQWLVRLRARAATALEHAQPAAQDDDLDVELLGWRTRLIERARVPHGGHHSRDHSRQGSRSNAGQGVQQRSSAAMVPSASNSVPPPPPAPPLVSPGVTAAPPAPLEQMLLQHFAAPAAEPQVGLATDLFLHQFWDPTTLGIEGSGQDGGIGGLTTANWWNWDAELATQLMGSGGGGGGVGTRQADGGQVQGHGQHRHGQHGSGHGHP